MFSIRKYFAALTVLCVLAVASRFYLPAFGADTAAIVLVGGAVALVLRCVYGFARQTRERDERLVALIRQQGAAHSLKFGENESRVRQLGGLVREVERAVAGLGEVQGLKFGENESRVRQLGGLVREVERATASLTEKSKAHPSQLISDVAKRKATAELKISILDDLASVRELLRSHNFESTVVNENFGLSNHES